MRVIVTRGSDIPLRFIKRQKPLHQINEYGEVEGYASMTIEVLQCGKSVVESDDPNFPVGMMIWEDVPTMENEK